MNRTLPGLAFRILLTGLAAATAGDIGRTIYQWAAGFPPVNWNVSGRWFLMVLSGHPYVENMPAAPSLPHEQVAGHVAYYTISLIFAGIYLFLLDRTKREPALLNGLLFGWVTMVFPFLVQMPLMGMGAFASNTQVQGLIIGRTLVHHSSFGLGLAIGAMVAASLLRRR